MLLTNTKTPVIGVVNICDPLTLLGLKDGGRKNGISGPLPGIGFVPISVPISWIGFSRTLNTVL